MKVRAVQSLARGDLGPFFRLLAVFVALGVCANAGFALATTDREQLFVLREFSELHLLAAVLLTLVPWLTNALRTLVWLQFVGLHMTLLDAWKLVLATELGSAVTPTAAGGGYVKAAMLVQRGLPAGKAASLMVIGTLENATFFAIALPITLTLTRSWELPIIQTVFGEVASHLRVVITIVGTLALAAWAGRVLRGRVKSTRDPNRRLTILEPLIVFMSRLRRDFLSVYAMIGRRGKSRFALNVGIAAAGWVCRYSVVTLLVAGLGAAVHPLKFAMLQWVVFTVVTFIPTPGGAGAAEASFYLVYGELIAPEVLGIATAGWRFFTFYFLLVLGAAAFASLTIAQRSRGTVLPPLPPRALATVPVEQHVLEER
jgi:uncharacterized protein (TIRG00374 family)